jgi:Alpha/beta hydrolase domain
VYQGAPTSFSHPGTVSTIVRRALIKAKQATGPMGGLTVRKAVLAGTSATAGTLIQYLPAQHMVFRTPDMQRIYDGFPPTSNGSVIQAVDVPAHSRADDARGERKRHHRPSGRRRAGRSVSRLRITKAQLKQLYGSKQNYRAKMEKRLTELEKAGWSLPVYRPMILADAANVDF